MHVGLQVMGLVLGSLVLIATPPLVPAAERAAVEKVERLIRKLEQAEPVKEGGSLRSETIRENEINAYIAHLIQLEKRKVLKSLTLALSEDNKVTGKALFALEELGLGSLFPPEMRFDFEGVIETRDRTGRFHVRKLFLEDKPVKPEILDVVFLAIANAYDTEPSSINNWYHLPYGIDSVKTAKGTAFVYY